MSESEFCASKRTIFRIAAKLKIKPQQLIGQSASERVYEERIFLSLKMSGIKNVCNIGLDIIFIGLLVIELWLSY